MKNSREKHLRQLVAPAGLVLMLSLTLLLRGQERENRNDAQPQANARGAGGEGVASDWSHRHLIFSNPETADEAIRNGDYERWLKITNDPRYMMQQIRRSGAGSASLSLQNLAPAEEISPSGQDQAGDHDDAAQIGSLPAERDHPAVTPARGLIRALVPPASLHSDWRPDPPRIFHHPFELLDRNRFQRDWSETIGSSGTVGMGNFPATFTHTSASCTTDFAVYNTSMAGSSSQPSIVAFNQLYGGCTSRPSTYWAFDTGGIVQTSVTLSLDGTQAAFVQTDNTTGDADFVVLKWAASSGTLASPTLLTSNSAFPNCTAPCMISIPFSGSPTDSYSSPFIVYYADVAYVGDDAGAVHQFTNVFSSGAPAEAGSPWPVTINTSTDAALASPVYDAGSGNVFVGDYLANVSSNCEPGIKTPEGQCGYLYSVNATSGAVTRSAQLDSNLGIYDSPIVDSSAGMVYAFVGADDSTNCSSGPCAAVFQLPVGFTSGATGTEATVGAGYESLLSGSFDNQYFTSASPPSGHLYVVGGTGEQNNTLYAITIANNTMTSGGASAGPQLATNYTNDFYAPGL